MNALGDSSAQTTVYIQQKACIKGTNCPTTKNVTKDLNGTCKGTLTKKSKYPIVTMNFTESNQYIWSKRASMDFFDNSDPEKCPLTNCTLRQPDCRQVYDDGIKVENSFGHFGIYAITNFPDGWVDPLCLICENKDEVVSVPITVDQLSCS